jgi:hypothetical protein
MREALAVNLGESPVRPVTGSHELRRLSFEIDQKISALEEKQNAIRKASNELLPLGEGKIADFIKERESVAKHGVTTFREVKRILLDLRSEGSIDRNKFKRFSKELDDEETALALERGALARDRARIALAISASRLHERLGQAYMMAITQKMAAPKGATIFLSGPRESSDQSNFRKKLILTYNEPGDIGRHVQWCPIVKHYFDSTSRDMVAAHVVPYCIGETNMAYLVGVPLDEGFSAMWSEKNGLLIHYKIEEAYGAGQLVIVPRRDDNSILTVVLLDESIADQLITMTGPGAVRFKDLGDLEFKTDARPGRRNLYISTLFTIFRRKRYGVLGHERDFDKLSMADNSVWASPGKWMRRSVLQYIAAEVGDVFPSDIMNKIIGLDDFPDEESAEQEDRRAADIRYSLEYGTPNEEDEEGFDEGEEEAHRTVIEVGDEFD